MWHSHRSELPAGILLRRASPDDTDRLQALEQQAAVRFRSLGLNAVAEADPLPQQWLVEAALAGRLLMLETLERSQAIGLVMWRPLAGWLLIEELDIHPEWAGRRLGRALIARALQQAREQQLAGLVLTTFRLVPWNAPYYMRLGFAEWDPEGAPKEFVEILQTETEKFSEPRCILMFPHDSDLVDEP
jgi:N-acetylglutamate synthase-like GNAT family acetyltransferase